MHDVTIIKTIAYGLVAALFFALIAKRLGLQPLVGYLVAGIAIGPFTPGFVGDVKIASQLAEIGVILLMFGVGLHFNLKDLLAVRSIALPGAIFQIFAATLCGVAIASSIGWSLSAGLVLGIATSVASTVVLLKVLIDFGVLDSPQGHIAVGWLLVEDVITVMVLVLLPIFAISGVDGIGVTKSIFMVILKFGLLCGLVMVAGGKFVPILLTKVARLRSQELFTLTVLVLSISVAAFSYFAFGTSMALGAFLAGMVVGQSSVSHQAASDVLPMRDAFAVLFFVAAGMLFDYRVVIDYPLLTFGVLFIVLVVKPIAALLIVILLGHPLKVGLTVAAALAQIGEFSFILGEVGTRLDLMPAYGQSVLVAVAIVSISLNTFIFKYMTELEPALYKFAALRKWLDSKESSRIKNLNIYASNSSTSNKKRKAVIVGYGIVGRTVARAFEGMGIEPIIIETNINTVNEIQSTGKIALFGDATRKDILKSAGLSDAAYLVIAISDMQTTMAILQSARKVSKQISTFARCHYERDRHHLLNAGALAVSSEERLAAASLAENILALNISSKFQIRKEIKRIQEEIKIEVANIGLS